MLDTPPPRLYTLCVWWLQAKAASNKQTATRCAFAAVVRAELRLLKRRPVEDCLKEADLKVEKEKSSKLADCWNPFNSKLAPYPPPRVFPPPFVPPSPPFS